MISLIVAYAENNVIGNNGKIPWSIKGEQLRFKELTTGNVVIMGRKSFEEIGRPLPNRETIVISNTKIYTDINLKTAKNLKEALDMAGDKNVFISGGERLYNEVMPIVDKMYITEVDAVVEGDTCFPPFNENDFIKKIEKEFFGEIPYKYITYTKKV